MMIKVAQCQRSMLFTNTGYIIITQPVPHIVCLQTQKFDARAAVPPPTSGFANPTGEADYPQPSIFVGKLKTYQIKVTHVLALLIPLCNL